jgi:P-type Ca2+ transporter type 2C
LLSPLGMKALKNWHQLQISQVLKDQATDSLQGLSQAEVLRRRLVYGTNTLIEQALKSPWRILWEQLTAATVLLLAVSALVSVLLKDYQDAAAMLAIVLLTSAIGFTQDYRVNRAIAALRKLNVPQARVCRGGQWQDVSAQALVPGDIVQIEAGQLIPADGRVIESVNLKVQESAFTGESEPVEKMSDAIAAENLGLSDRRNMAYLGTTAIYGKGRVVITETGMNTQLGQIANLVQTSNPELTPLQKRLEQLGRKLVLAAILLIVVIVVLGLLRGEGIKLLFLTGVSMAVAVVPEGLPAIVTISLAIGAQRMLKQRSLIRNLPAVETLGSVTVICADKTGTLTQNRMTVAFLAVAGHRIDLSTQMRNDKTTVSATEALSPLFSKQPSLALLLAGAALCNNARLEAAPDAPERFSDIGDPTEGALAVAAARLGLWKGNLEKAFPRIAEIPFESERQRMTTIHRLITAITYSPASLEPLESFLRFFEDWPCIAFTKGGVESLLKISSCVWSDDHAEPLDVVWQQSIMDVNNELALEGMRVLGVAFRGLESFSGRCNSHELEQNLTFIGIIGMRDPARPEAREAVLACQRAGIRPIMLTGDQPLTAQHIARELGITTLDRIPTGQMLDCLSPEEFKALVGEASVFARVSPQQKLAIVQALQSQGHIVAMTGDGINDAPALRKADIGVAMGMTGTDVAKEAADMVLLDDNFATIVAAVREGRVIYDNIRKSIKYLLSSNSGEVGVMILAPLLGMPLPLLPIQILWINLLTDGLPALALSVEPAEQSTMHRFPYPPTETIFGRGAGSEILLLGLMTSFICTGTGYWYWQVNHAATWQTMIFTVLTFSELGIVLAVRSDRDSLFQLGLLSNRLLLGAVILTLGLQLSVVYLPPLQKIFMTEALSLEDLGLCLLMGSSVLWMIELKKWVTAHLPQ